MLANMTLIPPRPTAAWNNIAGPELDAWATTVVKARQSVSPHLKSEWWLFRTRARATLTVLRATHRRLERLPAQIAEYRALGGQHPETYEANLAALKTRYLVLGALIWKGATTRAETPESRFYVNDTVFTLDGVCMAVGSVNPATQLSLQAKKQSASLKNVIKTMRRGLTAASASARNLRPVA